jgi:hypothetical protein
MEEQAPNQALFLNDSPSSFMVLFIAVSFFCDAWGCWRELEQFPLAILICF